MSQDRKNFIDINEGFSCLHCGAQNSPVDKSCRNHCTQCLYSLHVDDQVPGDRKSECRGLMKPTALDYDGKKGQMIVHECLTCAQKMRNIVAPDDDQDALIPLSHSAFFS